ncbi:MAG: hypothetical protein JO063_05910 [Pseudonocardiales bacterium]|nr:hypothetical protein [Pseudonocardiales bacterium]MBV9028978.1 hypothetical protein [Pseudonocardiales bacterium]MBW0009644.1 hypothetical protein [Pseudonocardiales bacterium]
MRRSSEPEERAQFTVAELLARYGEAPPPPGRRHRRAAEDPDPPVDTAAQRSDSTPPHLNGRAGQGWAPAVGPSSVGPSSVVAGRVPVTSPPVAERAPVTLPPAHGRAPVTPPPVPGRAPLRGTALFDGSVTDRLPRLDPAPVSTATRAVPEPSENTTDEAPEQEPGSPLWEWAVMMSQIGIGVVGGAALWLICEWLWQRIPVLALVVALAVITGLVWVVRRVRRAEDLQTTVIAVLVGLFVTVSPAALLLVGR